MHRPDPLLSLTPSLSEQLKSRADELRLRIVRSNYNTQFAQTTSELAEFRDATAGRVNEMDRDTLSDTFRKAVQFTTYDSYAPLVARFFEEPCKASAIVDLFAPGIPDYIAKSSSTSGGVSKPFPKYNRLSHTKKLDNNCWTISDPLFRRTTALVLQYCVRSIHVEDENNGLVKTMYATAASIANRRTSLHLHPEEDKEKMATFLFDHAAPFAAGFIRKWRSFLLIQALFALASKSLETIVIVFTSAFVDMMRHLDSELDTIVDCIANGTIPELEGIADVRHYLEENMLPDPERAAELRNLGRPSLRSGWCSLAWPSFQSINAIASGSFVTYLPLVRWYLGAGAEIRSVGYGCTEAAIASPYNPLELNQYKLNGGIVVEFLDITQSDSITLLAQVWEVEVGRRYEIVLTTPDGLWRYRLGDVIQILGFDPTDGAPIIQFIERRNVAIRLHFLMITEKELSAALLSMVPNAIARIVGWTTMMDDGRSPPSMVFFIELADDQVSDFVFAKDRVLDELSRSNERVLIAIKRDLFGKPTIQFLRSGTFSEYFQMRLDEGGRDDVGQIKVPVILSNAIHMTWFSDRVVQEL